MKNRIVVSLGICFLLSLSACGMKDESGDSRISRIEYKRVSETSSDNSTQDIEDITEELYEAEPDDDIDKSFGDDEDSKNVEAETDNTTSSSEKNNKTDKKLSSKTETTTTKKESSNDNSTTVKKQTNKESSNTVVSDRNDESSKSTNTSTSRSENNNTSNSVTSSSEPVSKNDSGESKPSKYKVSHSEEVAGPTLEDKQKVCKHDWRPQYKSVFHGSVVDGTRTEWDYDGRVVVGTQCDNCGVVFVGEQYASWLGDVKQFYPNYKVEAISWDKHVNCGSSAGNITFKLKTAVELPNVVQAGWEELIVVGYICPLCKATKEE